MTYVISDIHGCYDEYCELLEKIAFGENDELYVLGDAVDRGPEPIAVLRDMMCRPNVTFILGNHDFVMYVVLRKMSVEITEENYETHLDEQDLMDYQMWFTGGGEVTAEQFARLTYQEKMDVLDYLSEASVYETIRYDGKTYILVHAGLGDFRPDKALEDYELNEFLEERADYSREYFPGESVYLVTGHTPTVTIPGWGKHEVYQQNGHIAIDCGCVFGGRLAAYCIETGKVTYADGRLERHA